MGKIRIHLNYRLCAQLEGFMKALDVCRAQTKFPGAVQNIDASDMGAGKVFGDCASAVSAEIPNPYNYGLDKIKAAHLPHAMAYPQRYVIDPSLIGTPEADKAQAACKAGAIDLAMQEEMVELAVGAVVWAKLMEPRLHLW